MHCLLGWILIFVIGKLGLWKLKALLTDALTKSTRRTTGARECYFLTSVYPKQHSTSVKTNQIILISINLKLSVAHLVYLGLFQPTLRKIISDNLIMSSRYFELLAYQLLSFSTLNVFRLNVYLAQQIIFLNSQ